MINFHPITSGAYAYSKSLKWAGKIRYLGIASHVAEICHRFIELGDIDFIMFSVNSAYDINPVLNLPFEELDVKGAKYHIAVKERQKLFLLQPLFALSSLNKYWTGS